MEWLFGGGFLIFVLLAMASLAVWVWALVDVIRVPEDSMFRSGDRVVWILVIVLAGIVGAIIYLAAGRPQRGSQPAPIPAPATSAGLPPPPPPR